MLTRMRKNRNFHLLLVELQNGIVTEWQFGSIGKLNKYSLTIQPHKNILSYPTDLKSYVYIKTCMRNFIEIPFITSKKTLSRIFFHRWADRQTVVHPVKMNTGRTYSKWNQDVMNRGRAFTAAYFTYPAGMKKRFSPYPAITTQPIRRHTTPDSAHF